MSQKSMLGLWGNIVFLFCIISNTDALQFRPSLPGDYDSQGHALRALEGPECWYPNYYCSVTEANTQTPTVVTGGASTCYDKCNGDGTCKFFTWFKRRGVEYCYLLTECGKDYQIDDDWCTARKSCFSGPSDCSTVSNNNTVCAKLDTASNLIEWQCENGGTGLYLNGYNGTLNTGARCMLSCASWQSFRWAAKSAVTYPEKGFLFSTCQADGSWSDVLPNDFKDDKTSLEWPRPSDLHRTNYPKPNEGSLSCGCSDLVLAWPPQNASSGLEAFYYNPRDEEGATMECEDEVQNSEVALTNEFRIKSNNTCRFLCDNILVATVKCSNGKWTGEVDRGFWCYEYPKEENMLKNYLNRMTPRNGSMSSEGPPGFGIDNCIFESFSGICKTDADKFRLYKWMAVEMDCIAVIQQIKFKFHVKDVERLYMSSLKVMIANTVPTTDMVPFEDGETVATYDGPTITEDYVWNKRIENPVPGKTVVFQIKKDGPPGRMSAKSIELFGTCSSG